MNMNFEPKWRFEGEGTNRKVLKKNFNFQVTDTDRD